MEKTEIKVLHVDSERSWRGGQQQAVYLYERMLKKGFATQLVCQPNSDLEAYCQSRKIPVKTIRFRHELDLIGALQLAHYACREGFNILQLHSGHALSWGLLTKLFFRNLVLVATRRVDFSVRKHFLSRYKYNSSLLNHIVCISQNISDVLIADGIMADKLSIIHSGINTHRFDSVAGTSEKRRKWHIPEDAILIGTVAAFTGHKDYPNLLKAAELVLHAKPDVYFIALGDGKLFKDMKFWTYTHKISDRFIFVGESKDVGAYLKSMDIFVLASKKEGLGTSVLDAQSVGLPIIGTMAGGIPEMIEHGINGLLVPVKDHEALAHAILQLIDNPELRQRLGKKALETVRSFDIDTTVDKYLALYAKLLNA